MRRADLVAECARCAGLCCVATSFEASQEFAIDKPLGVACPHLSHEARCAIHADRARRGFAGCTLYDCYGAGPRVTRMYEEAPRSDARRDAVFLAMRELHELLWLLSEAAKLCPASRADLRAALSDRVDMLEATAGGSIAELLALDLEAQQRATRALLRRVGEALGGRAALRALPIVK